MEGKGARAAKSSLLLPPSVALSAKVHLFAVCSAPSL